MPRNSASIREAWERLPTPAKSKGFRTFRVEGTNAWVFKTPSGGFGMLLAGVSPPSGMQALRNIRLTFKPQKEVVSAGGVTTLPRCLEIELDAGCDPTTLARLFDRLGEDEPSGTYSTSLVMRTLNDVIKVVQAAPSDPGVERVVGAWGELHFLLGLLLKATTPKAQRTLLNSWESEGDARDIIDFRFRDARTAVEVKTSVGKRIHHFHGYGQAKTPPGFAHGVVASYALTATEPPLGATCRQLVAQVRGAVQGDSSERRLFEKALEAKLELRGRECDDHRFAFDAGPDALALFRMETIPRPPETPGVTEVEWTADLSNLVPEQRGPAEKLLSQLTA